MQSSYISKYKHVITQPINTPKHREFQLFLTHTSHSPLININLPGKMTCSNSSYTKYWNTCTCSAYQMTHAAGKKEHSFFSSLTQQS
jgi:hypothetical protein